MLYADAMVMDDKEHAATRAEESIPHFLDRVCLIVDLSLVISLSVVDAILSVPDLNDLLLLF